MPVHLMVDLETLSIKPSAVILSLGAVKFDPYSTGILDQLYFRIDIDSQLDRDIETETLEWWAKQDPAIQQEAFDTKDRIELSDAMEQFHRFAWHCRNFWSHGSTFDLIILENVCRQLKRSPPWLYHQLRDTRTLFDLGQSPDMPTQGKHDALQDAIRQATGVQNVYRKLGISPA